MRLTRGRWANGVAMLLVAAMVPGVALAQYVYPTKGQNPQQQQKDEAECQGWATQQAGNPGAVPPPQQSGQVLRTAGRGAAVGAVGGAIGGNAGKGAAIGAATGALVGGIRKRDQQQQYEAAQAQVSANNARAYSACLEGRGYTVK